MRISVALATFNGAPHLREQLESILWQSEPINELVISDDDSADDTTGIAQRVVDDHRFRSLDPPDFVITSNRGTAGVAANFGSALAHTTGDVVFLSDQDDIWHIDRVARAMEVFRRRADVLMVGSDAQLVDESGAPISATLFSGLRMSTAERESLLDGDPLPHLLRRNLLTGAASAVRSQLISDALPIPPGWLHDEWLALVAALRRGLCSIPDVLIDYRQHGANVVGVDVSGVRGDLRRLMTPRDDRDRRLLLRAEQLLGRLDAMAPPIDGEIRSAVVEKLAHEMARSALPRRRWARVRPVLSEMATGRYHRFGGGARDVLRDVVQPVG